MLVSNTSATFAYRKIVIVSIVVLVCAAMISGILYMTVPSVRAQLSSGPTTPSGSTIVDLMEEGLAEGLYPTGVTGDKTPAGNHIKIANAWQGDPHWTLDGIQRPPGDSALTCQWMWKGRSSDGTRYPSSTSAYYPASGAAQPAQIITEEFPRVGTSALGAGFIRNGTYDTNAGRLAGVQTPNPHSSASDGRSVWDVLHPNSRWIGQNSWGVNTTQNSCEDPTLHKQSDIEASNIYIFKPTGGFTLDDSVDLSRVTLYMRGYVDNAIKVYINGVQIPLKIITAPGADDPYSLGWVAPGFSSDAKPVETQQLGASASSILKKGDGRVNDLEIRVASTYGFTGLMIPDITLNMEVPPEYNLVPLVSDLPQFIDLPQDITATRSVANAGDTANTNNTWQSKRVIVKQAGVTMPVLSYSPGSATDACTYLQSIAGGGSACSSIDSGSTGAINPGSSYGAGTTNQLIDDDLTAGNQVCITMSVRNRASSSTEWAHSIKCTLVGKKPKVQVLGGDVMVGRGIPNESSFLATSKIQTSLTPKNNGLFGSWSEYSALAPSRIANFASGAGLSGDNGGVAGSGQADWSKLTFANTSPAISPAPGSCHSSANKFGCYVPLDTIMPDIATKIYQKTQAEAAYPSNSVNLSSFAGSVVKRSGTSFLTINASAAGATLAPGREVIVYAPEATVRINGNIRYTDSPITVDQIPQLIIVAKNIHISQNVTNLDAWLVSSGSINTCYEHATGSLNSNLCSQQLTVNGPVLTDKLFLRRTAGSGTGVASGEPAERFNLRADAYIWANKYAQAGIYRSGQYKELPPRF